jgi:integrase
MWASGAVEPAVLLLGHWLDRWLALRLPIVRPQTRRNYQNFVDACAPIAAIPLSRLSTEDLQVLTNTLLGRWSRSHVNAWRAIISSALLAAVPRYLVANPMAGVRLPKAEQRPVKSWRAAEVAALLTAARGRAHETWLWLSLGTGIRLGEARALRWANVDLINLTITISEALDHDTDELGPPKGGKTRIVDLPEELVPVLKEHAMRQRPGETYVCTSSFSRHVPDPKTVELWLRRLCDQYGLTRHSPHATRHTCASLMLAKGVPITEVARILGHSSPAITMQIYAHFLEQGERRGAKAIGAVLSAAASPRSLSLKRTPG